MNCPKCDTVYLCACGSCASRHTTESTWKFEGDLITCPCGFSMHCDGWLDLEMNAYKAMKESK